MRTAPTTHTGLLLALSLGSLLVPGTFPRSYDGVSSGATDPSFEATVATFRLDKYEITVGRFRTCCIS